ncbi:OsmC family protein [Amycolatopsis magusensis]|uniref:OsmC family protein n=1 Tax=Amycolatopsis magusensis TaxID=882444 RepID=UPI0024A9C6D9|nr:OsmC family protein [Amycolatopsis magusensis]MDI5982076.1 OsmC family protein [Amycolatopsis magusensis]
MKEHRYAMTVTWTGNQGEGTARYRDYSRAHDVYIPGKPVLAGSADPAFLGDPTRWNPEELLVASLSECHMLWVLALAAAKKVVITGYTDEADGVMVEEADGGGQFREVTLRPVVTVAEPGMVAAAEELHAVAHAKCFIARSMNFPVRHEPRTLA